MRSSAAWRGPPRCPGVSAPLRRRWRRGRPGPRPGRGRAAAHPGRGSPRRGRRWRRRGRRRRPAGRLRSTTARSAGRPACPPSARSPLGSDPTLATSACSIPDPTVSTPDMLRVHCSMAVILVTSVAVAGGRNRAGSPTTSSGRIRTAMAQPVTSHRTRPPADAHDRRTRRRRRAAWGSGVAEDRRRQTGSPPRARRGPAVVRDAAQPQHHEQHTPDERGEPDSAAAMGVTARPRSGRSPGRGPACRHPGAPMPRGPGRGARRRSRARTRSARKLGLPTGTACPSGPGTNRSVTAGR